MFCETLNYTLPNFEHWTSLYPLAGQAGVRSLLFRPFTLEKHFPTELSVHTSHFLTIILLCSSTTHTPFWSAHCSWWSITFLQEHFTSANLREECTSIVTHSWCTS